MQLVAAIAAARAEDVARQAFAVHAHERRFGFRDLPFHEREMMGVIDRRAIHVQIEIAVIGRQFHHLLAHDQFLLQTAMGDQALDRADPQLVFFLELHQLRQTRHRSVVVQDFAEHTGRLQARQPRQIDCRLRMTGAPQNAAFLRAQRENVTRLHKILRHRISASRWCGWSRRDRAR